MKVKKKMNQARKAICLWKKKINRKIRKTMNTGTR